MNETVAIIGMGLMGGSLGLALRSRGKVGTVRGYARREAARNQALSGGFVDAIYDSAVAAVEDADLVVLCTPVLTMPGLVREIHKNLKPGCMVTDVGSTKAWLTASLQKELVDSGVTYVGSHPMAGSEKVGMDAAREELYEGACVLVTAADDIEAGTARLLQQFWEGVGATVTIMSPNEHDRLIARTSHLPHMMAALLVEAVDRDKTTVFPFCGPGFRDTTRIAAGSEDVWHDIVKSNAHAIRDELDVLKNGIDKLCGLIDEGDFEAVREFLAVSRRRREAFRNCGQQGE